MRVFPSSKSSKAITKIMIFSRCILFVATLGGLATAHRSGDHHHRHHHSAYKAAVEAAGGPASAAVDAALRGTSTAVVVNGESSKNKKHSAFENLNHKVTVHGRKFYLDQYKPAAEIPEMTNLMEHIKQVEEEEESQVKIEQDAIHKVEDEFLNSDLHKEALTMKLNDDITFEA